MHLFFCAIFIFRFCWAILPSMLANVYPVLLKLAAKPRGGTSVAMATRWSGRNLAFWAVRGKWPIRGGKKSNL